MKLIEINWNPSHRQLQQFGVISLFALPFVGWIWNAELPILVSLVAIGFVVAALSLLIPEAVKPLFLGLSIVAIPIGLVLGELAILSIYFGVFLPIGLFFRLMRRDALKMCLDGNAETYWQAKKRPSSAISYYRQF